MSAGGPRPSAFYVERQALTRSPATPTVPNKAAPRDSTVSAGQVDPGQGNPQPGDGLALAGLFSVVVSIWPNAGSTLNGAGSLLCWVFNPYQGGWSRCPDFDLTVSTIAGLPSQTFAPIKSVARLGLLINWAFSGLAVTNGQADALLRIDGFTSVGSQGA